MSGKFVVLLVLLMLGGFAISCGTDADDDDPAEDGTDDDTGDDADDDGTGDDDSEVDDDTDDDDTFNGFECDDDDAGSWPDDTAPVEGWVIVADNDDLSRWNKLYHITADSYTEVTPPGDYVFRRGSLPTRTIGWAIDYDRSTRPEFNLLYDLSGGQWAVMDPAPPCDEPGVVDVVRFRDGSGYALCRGGQIAHWSNQTWTILGISLEGAAAFRGIACVSSEECVLWNYDSIYWFDGTRVFEDPESPVCTVKVILQNPCRAYRIYNPPCDGEYEAIERYDNGLWTSLDPLVPDYLYAFHVARVDGAHTAVSYETEAGRWNIVIGPNDEPADLDWPFLFRMNFGAGGGGIGVGDTGYYRLMGRDAEFIVAPDNEYRATFDPRGGRRVAREGAMRRIFILVAVLSAIGALAIACRSNDDDDDPADGGTDDDSADDDNDLDDESGDDDADDDTADDDSGWPDEFSPAVGWVALGERDTGYYKFDSLYFISEIDALPEPVPSEYAFWGGFLPARDIGWAQERAPGIMPLYALDAFDWEPVDPQPPCDGGTFRLVRRFVDGTGYVLCHNPPKVLLWDGAEWSDFFMLDDRFIGAGMICLDKTHCVVVAQGLISYYDGVDLEEEDPIGYCIQAMEYQNADLIYRAIALASDGCDDEHIIEKRVDGVWVRDTDHFPDPLIVQNGVYMARIDDRHMAFAYDQGDEMVNTVLRDDGAVVDQDWPPMRQMAFAPGGGGFGVAAETGEIFRIEGRDATSILTYDPALSVRMILAADAE
ncbi:MAG: hypothetical protein M5R36_26085 [Deltaproteobacteria bacterium]|nr:hypothetical protein [Deltaproteobacteria bacterium]